MRKLLLLAGMAALAIPSIALAQTGCLEQRHDNAVVGDVAGGSSADCGFQAAGYHDDNGAWHATEGHYDANGDWVDGPAPAPSADSYNADVAYVGPAGDLSGREDWMEQRIQVGEDRGALSHYDADGDRGRLSSIRDLQGRLRDDHDGLTADDRSDLNSRLDDLGASVNAQWRD